MSEITRIEFSGWIEVEGPETYTSSVVTLEMMLEHGPDFLDAYDWYIQSDNITSTEKKDDE